MSFFQKRGNNALNVNNASVNGGPATLNISTVGSDWYWAVCAVMTVATFSFIGLALTKPRSHRVFHYITAGVTMVAAIAYFTMGSDLGRVPIRAEFTRGRPAGITREIFYVRYIDWVITTPLLLLDLLLTAALPLPTILFVVLVDEVMIITGLIGALVSSSYKWGYYVFGCVALFYILYQLIWEARRSAGIVGQDVGRAFFMCGTLTAFLWTLYPIAWGLSEGGNVISPNGEAFFYGVLDLLAKPVFGALLIWGHRGIDPARLGLAIQDYTEKDAFINSKHSNGGAGTNGTHGVTGTNGTTNGHGATGTNGTTTTSAV
ncbi:family A G protein-coupled receptor-like protein [Myriangium duriaei CBS 260.36]|uniref:Family A G protein-coupled receptor-like protein n=1 Tax=Myriangium duriaei CBS 260.36 TaxID=1168546 RepID=A0A9P4JCF6_9PEZI|nr:family A G protein-coupled receptor-like protein [Myriangium duriaei CBS 260.36]